MFDENQLVTVSWYSGNKQYYVDLGYTFTKFKDTFQVPFYLTKKRSKILVKVICDYCGQEYITQYCNYQTGQKRGKSACRKCKQFKIANTLQNKYGSSSLWGCEEFRHRAKKSMKEKYGCEYAMQSEQGKEKFKKTMLDKYGVSNPAYSSELQTKAKASLYSNGTVPSSMPEKKMIKMLIQEYGKDSCFPGYPVDKVNLDCLLIFENNKIDLEYDGLYWHKDTKDYDRKRNHWLVSKGYKVLRIKGNKYDSLPSIEKIKEKIDYLLNGHSIAYIDMNN